MPEKKEEIWLRKRKREKNFKFQFQNYLWLSPSSSFHLLLPGRSFSAYSTNIYYIELYIYFAQRKQDEKEERTKDILKHLKIRKGDKFSFLSHSLSLSEPGGEKMSNSSFFLSTITFVSLFLPSPWKKDYMAQTPARFVSLFLSLLPSAARRRLAAQSWT